MLVMVSLDLIITYIGHGTTILIDRLGHKADLNIAILEKTRPDSNGKVFDAFSKMLSPIFYSCLIAVR